MSMNSLEQDAAIKALTDEVELLKRQMQAVTTFLDRELPPQVSRQWPTAPLELDTTP